MSQRPGWFRAECLGISIVNSFGLILLALLISFALYTAVYGDECIEPNDGTGAPYVQTPEDCGLACGGARVTWTCTNRVNGALPPRVLRAEHWIEHEYLDGVLVRVNRDVADHGWCEIRPGDHITDLRLELVTNCWNELLEAHCCNATCGDWAFRRGDEGHIEVRPGRVPIYGGGWDEGVDCPGGASWVPPDTLIRARDVSWDDGALWAAHLYGCLEQANPPPGFEDGILLTRRPRRGTASWIKWPFYVTGTCRGDVDGNGAVNIDDILATLVAWGHDDVYAEWTGDEVVDFADLHTVLQNWGPCP